MKILFIGDTKFDQAIIISEEVKNICQSADLVVLNLEGPIIGHDVSLEQTRIKRFSTDIALSYLLDLNVDVLNLANNHIMDFGEGGMKSTVKKLEGNGFLCTGLVEKLGQEVCLYKIIKAGRFNIGILSFCHWEGQMGSKNSVGPIPLPLFNILQRAITSVKKKADKVYFVYHGGEEYYTVPWPRRMSYFRFLAQNTEVDGIIGHHSHTIQPIEIIGGKPIIYSLGNFCFDSEVQRRQNFTDEGLLVLHETERSQLTLFRTKFDRVNATITLKDSRILHKNDIILNTQLLHEQWLKQCSSRLRARRGFFSKKIFWKFGIPIKKTYFFMRALKNRNRRDLDIFLATVPGLRRIHLRNSTSENSARKFKF